MSSCRMCLGSRVIDVSLVWWLILLAIRSSKRQHVSIFVVNLYVFVYSHLLKCNKSDKFCIYIFILYMRYIDAKTCSSCILCNENN